MVSLRSDALPDAVIVPPTGCPLDANSLAAFTDVVSNFQGKDPWDIAPYLYEVETIDRLKT